jgi:glycosyltransferase involved in cell wall biosynthesis
MFDFATLFRYSGATVNILFVGGVKPNKGHARAIRVFAEYHQNFNHRSRLIFAGGIDELMGGYVSGLKALASQLGVADHVIFTGAVTGSQIKSLYVSADVFLCTSEHEGFCVPLVEAMYFRVPIVAWGVTAVPETMGECSFVLEDWNEPVFAAHIDRLVQDDQTAERLGTVGRRRYQMAFAPGALRQKLDGIIAEVTQ